MKNNMIMTIKILFPIVLILTAINEIYVLPQIIEDSFELSEDGRLDFPELSAKYGHPAETQYVITVDGYNLTLYHIPGDKTRAILLVHGNTPTSDCWVMRGKTSLAITLANRGYDVWAINLRGTKYSRRHVSIDPDLEPKRFFNFSFYEQSIYDLPATVDFVLNDTGQKQLLTVGHSVGCTLYYVMGAERPEYNDKIKLAISLAPVSYIQHLRGVASMRRLIKPLIQYLKKTNAHEILSYDQLGAFLQTSCFTRLGHEICVKGLLFSLLGYDEESIDPDFMFNFFGHWPGGSTLKTFEHLAQVRDSNRFAKFDYGRKGNLRVYHRPDAPEFDLGKVTMRSALFVGREDYLASVPDSIRLNRSLPNVVHYQVMPHRQFNHVDFIWGQKMHLNLYPYLLEVIEKYI